MASYKNSLQHYGIPGMHWGVRRYQNSDGTLTAAGKKRYSDGSDLSISSTSVSAYDKPQTVSQKIAFKNTYGNTNISTQTTKYASGITLSSTAYRQGSSQLSKAMKTIGSPGSSWAGINSAGCTVYDIEKGAVISYTITDNRDQTHFSDKDVYEEIEEILQNNAVKNGSYVAAMVTNNLKVSFSSLTQKTLSDGLAKMKSAPKDVGISAVTTAVKSTNLSDTLLKNATIAQNKARVNTVSKAVSSTLKKVTKSSK